MLRRSRPLEPSGALRQVLAANFRQPLSLIGDSMNQLLRLRLTVSTLLPAALIAAACTPSTTTTTATVPAPATAGTNPFLVESTLPYHAPRFDLIRNENYHPAFEEGRQDQLAEFDPIASQTPRPTLRNRTVERKNPARFLSGPSKTSSALLG